MSGGGGFRPPWRRSRPAAAIEHVPPAVQGHIDSISPGPQAVRRAREAVTGRLPAVGVTPGSAFADAVLLVTVPAFPERPSKPSLKPARSKVPPVMLTAEF